MRSKRETQVGIEKLGDFQYRAERQERPGHRGPEGLKEVVKFSKQLLGRGGKETGKVPIEEKE